MSTPIELPSDTLAVRAATQRVYTKYSWSQTDWTFVPYLHVVSLTQTCAPDIGRATLVYRYGYLTQVGGLELAVWPPLVACDREGVGFDVEAGGIGRFLKIEIDVPDSDPVRTLRWDGYLVDDDRQPGGAYTDGDGVRRPHGVQVLTALGLEWLLTETILDSSYVETGDGGVQRVARAISFNGYKGTGDRDAEFALIGNRSSEEAADGGYVFAGTLSTDVAQWNARQAIEYLLKWWGIRGAPQDVPVLAGQHVPIELADSSLIDAMAWDRPVIACEGRTTWELLNELLDRRRSLAFYLAVRSPTDEELDLSPDAQEKLVLHVATFNPDAIVLIDETTGLTDTIPGNPNPRSFDPDASLKVEGLRVRRSALTMYDQIVVRGARRRSVFTVSHADGTLEEDWGGSTWHNVYNAGASGAGDYPSGDTEKRAERNRLVRDSDALRRVYRYFKLPADWTGLVNDGEAGADDVPACPKLDAVGAVTEEIAAHWWPGLRLERQLPLLVNYDYTDDVAAPTDNTPASPDGSQLEYLEPFCCLKLPADGSGTDRWGLGERLPVSDRIRHQSNLDAGFHVSLRPQDQACGIVLEVVGGPQHMLAKTEFAPLTHAADEDGIFDWQNDLLATVSASFDDYCEARYPADDELTLLTSLHLRRQVIYVGERYRLDYVAPGTVLQIADGVLERSDEGGFARDDRPRLAAIARLAYEWHRRERVALEFAVRGITDACPLGHLITELGADGTAETVNTLITSVTYELGLAHGDPVRTQLTTNYAELDVAGVAGGRAG